LAAAKKHDPVERASRPSNPASRRICFRKQLSSQHGLIVVNLLREVSGATPEITGQRPVPPPKWFDSANNPAILFA
jgi:hypothetical protein